MKIRRALFYFGLLILTTSLHGQSERWVSTAQGDGGGVLPAGSVAIAPNQTWLNTFDPELNYVSLNPTGYTSRFIYESAEAQIVLRYDDSKRLYTQDDLLWTVEYELTYRTVSGSVLVVPGTLEVGVLPTSGDYSDIQMNIVPDAIWAGLTVTNVEHRVNGVVSADPLPLDLFFDLIIAVERRYVLAPPETPELQSKSASNNFLTLNWDYVEGAESYELEWIFVENDDPYIISNASLVRPYNMGQSATRVTTANNEYRIPLAYPTGIILARVRGIGEFLPDGSRSEGQWTGATEIGSTSSYSDVGDVFRYDWIGMNTDLNWQHAAEFAEQGLRKDVVQFFDGGFKVRQSKTLLNTDHTTMISDHVYDHLGRSSLQVLPYPVTGQDMAFQSGQLGSGASYFNKEDFDQITNWNTAVTFPSVGAGAFYSPLNAGIGIHGDLAPDAQGLPYLRSLYLNDGTGRLKEQAGAGVAHSLGSGHTSTNIYGTPASQYELDRLFGSEVGYVSHYKKTASTDPNGVTSVTYSDNKGRTIATALAGVVPSTMEPLDTDDGTTETILSDLTAFNQMIDDELVISQDLVIVATTDLTFNYQLPQSLFDHCISNDCIYDLRICLYRDGNILMDIDPGLPVGCMERPGISANTNDLFNYVISNVPAGTYTIDKVLSLNAQNLSQILNHPTTGILNTDFTQSPFNVPPCPEMLTLVPEPCDCNTQCLNTYVFDDGQGNLTYYDESGSITTDLNYINTIILGPTGLIATCQEGCEPLGLVDQCEMMRQLLEDDMSPGGQYFDNTPDEFLANGNPNLTYEPNGWWLPLVQPNLDLNTPLVFSWGTFNSVIDLRSNWPSDPGHLDELLEELIIEYHPEYCLYYKYCFSECIEHASPPIAVFPQPFYGPYHNTMYGTQDVPYDPNNSASLPYYNPLNMVPQSSSSSPDTYQPFPIAPSSSTDELINCWETSSEACSVTMPSWNLINFLEDGGVGYFSIWYVLEDPGGIHTYSSHIAATSGLGFTITQDVFDYFQTLHGVGLNPAPNSALIWDFTSGTFNPNSHITAYQFFRSQYDFFREYYAYGVFQGCQLPCGPRTPTVNGGLYDQNGFVIYYPLNPVFDNFHPGTGGMDVATLNTTVQNNSCGLSCNDVVQTIVNDFEQCLLNDPNSPAFTIADLNDLYDDLYAICTDDCVAEPMGSDQAATIVTPLPSAHVNANNVSEAQTFDDVIDIYNLYFNSSCGYPDAHPSPGVASDDDCPCSNIQSTIDILGLDAASPTIASDLVMAINDMDGAPSTPVTISTVQSWLDLCDGTTTPPSGITIAHHLVNSLSLPDMFHCPEDPVDPDCAVDATLQANTAAYILNSQAIQAFADQYMAAYTAHCLAHAETEEVFTMEYDLREYHYTLYYYDQADNLIKTVPPAGVDLRLAEYQEYDGNSIIGPGGYTTQSDLEDAVAANRDDPTYIFGWVNSFIRPNHEMETWYNYNSFQQVHKAETPNGGESQSWYDTEGRITVSQHAEQEPLDAYSYTRYDGLSRPIENGQLFELSGTVSSMYDLVLGRDNNYQNGFEDLYVSLGGPTELEQITRTYYTSPFDPPSGTQPISPQFQLGAAQHVRGRVASVTKLEEPASFPLLDEDYDQATHYSYDIHGNVNELVQEVQELHAIGQGFKKIDYDYDLLTGNVNEVHYQDEQWDEFHHKYRYDADNRLLEVKTSDDERVWEPDARYFYYAHGPLARTELGAKQVHGADHYYTLQGWLKGVNAPGMDADNDPGRDGADVTSIDHHFAQDDYSYSLGYYQNDFNPVQTSTALPNVAGGYSTALSGRQLYNGNIQTMLTALRDNTGNALALHGNAYTYDVLNRIRSQQVFSGTPVNNDLAGLTTNGAFGSEFHFDGNGNFWSLDRKEQAGSLMDDLKYWYYSPAGVYDPQTSPYEVGRTDQLAYVTDAAGQVLGDDLAGHNAANYTYDDIGRLSSDPAEDIDQVHWNLSNKIRRIERTAQPGVTSPALEFRYDPMGNRTVKVVKPLDANGNKLDQSQWAYNYYVRDAQGNPMAIYRRTFLPAGNDFDDQFMLDEQMLYGSERLGTRKPDVEQSFTFNTTASTNGLGENVITENANYGTLNPITHDPILQRILQRKRYELKNHLGNVLATISDRKVGVDDNSNGIVDHYLATQYSYSDYYPYGSLLPSRHAQTGNYRFAFNGMESDSEVHGENNSYTTHFRQYDPRISRWLSIDPEVANLPHQSPYVGFDNNPIALTDPLGNCTKCDEHKNPGGGNVTTPEGTWVMHDLDGNVQAIQGNEMIDGKSSEAVFFWNDKKQGFYSHGGSLYQNPNADWYDGATAAVGSAWDGVKALTTEQGRQDAVNGAVAMFQDIGNAQANQWSEEANSTYGTGFNTTTPTPIGDYLSLVAHNDLDWGWQQWSQFGTSASLGMMTSKGVGAMSRMSWGGNLSIGSIQISLMSKVSAPGMLGHRVAGLKVGKYQYAIDYHNWVKRKGNLPPIRDKFWHYHWGRGNTGKHHLQFGTGNKIKLPTELRRSRFGLY